MKNVARVISQIAFLIIFAILIIQARMNIWLILFGATLVGAVFLGRIYCGWICPINTVMRPINWLAKKIGYKRLGIPRVLNSRALPWIMLGLMIIVILISRLARMNVPILLLILGFGALVTLIFQPEVFHKYICPYGALQGLAAGISRKSYVVDKKNCNGCAICNSVCEAGAITIKNRKAGIHKGFCLQCGLCEQNCPRDIISYRTADR